MACSGPAVFMITADEQVPQTRKVLINVSKNQFCLYPLILHRVISQWKPPAPVPQHRWQAALGGGLFLHGAQWDS